MDQYFYSTNIGNDFIILPEAEAHHALKVLRKKVGDTILIVDGKGSIYESTFENEDFHNCKLRINIKYRDNDMVNSGIHIAIAPTKSHDRLEWFIEKSVELGIQEISFIATGNSERKNIKLNRIKKNAISSMKQSLKSRLPIINDIVPFRTFLNKCINSQKFIAYLDEKESPHLFKLATKDQDICVLIGPEGDFNPLEIENAKGLGFKRVSLGPSRLRTETAAIAACHILNLINQK